MTSPVSAVVIPASARYMQMIPTQTMKPPRLCFKRIYPPKPKYEANKRIRLIMLSSEELIAELIEYCRDFWKIKNRLISPPKRSSPARTVKRRLPTLSVSYGV